MGYQVGGHPIPKYLVPTLVPTLVTTLEPMSTISLVQAWYQSWSSIEFKDLVAQVSLDGVYQYINYDLNDSVHLKMDGLLRRWKLLALKYKRESHVIHDQITEILISMSKSDIQKLNLGELNIKEN